MVSTRRSGSLSGNNNKRSSSSEDKPPSPKRPKVLFIIPPMQYVCSVFEFVSSVFGIWERLRFLSLVLLLLSL